MASNPQFPIPVITAAIAAGQSLSNKVYLGHGKFVGIIVPTGWTTANLTFQGSVDGTNFFELYDAFGNEITAVVTTAPSMISIDKFEGAIWIKVRSGTSASAVNQVSAVSLLVMNQKLFFTTSPR